MPIRLRNGNGETIEVPDDAALGYYKAQGYEPETAEQSFSAVQAEAAKPVDRGLIGTVNAGATSLLSGATLGLSDVVLSSLSTVEERRRLLEDREANPIVSMGANVIGSVAPALAAPGSLLGSMPAGIVGRASAAGFEAGRAAGGLAGVAQAMGATAVEGAMQSAGAYLADTALADRKLSAEGMFGAIGLGATFGAAAGGAMLGIERGTIAARRMFARTANADKAAAEAEAAWQAAHQSTIEANDTAAEVAKAKLAQARLAREQADLAKQQAGAFEADVRAAAPDIDAYREQFAGGFARREAELQRLALPAPGATSIETIVPSVSPAKLQELAEAVAEHDAARIELDDLLRRLDAPEIEPGVASQVTVPRGQFDDLTQQGPLAQGTPVQVTTVGKKLGEGTPTGFETTAFDSRTFDPKTRTYHGEPIASREAAPPETATGVFEKPEVAVEKEVIPAREISSEQEWRQLQDDLRAKLTPEEIKQSLRYSREYYIPANRSLRGTHKIAADDQQVVDAILPKLDSVIDKSPIPEPLVTHRAAHFDPGEAGYELKPGDLFVDPGYMSTSYKSDNINRFGNVHFVITSPRGTKLAAIPSSGGEKELTLARNTGLRITGREELPGGGIRLHATVETQGGAPVGATRAAEWTPVDRPGGGTQGGEWFKDETGQQWFGKSYSGNRDRVEGEHVADQLYRMFGVSAPETKIATVSGRPTMMSREVAGDVARSAKALEGTDITDGFVIDAWLGNRDVVGLNFDNAIVSGGKAHRIDNGGSLIWRAQGEAKDFGREVSELTTMRDPKYPAGRVFGKLTDADVDRQLQSFASNYQKNRAAIDQLIDQSGLSEAAKKKVRDGLHQRAEWLMEKAVAAPADDLLSALRATESKLDSGADLGKLSALSESEFETLGNSYRSQLSPEEIGHVREYTYDTGYALNRQLRKNAVADGAREQVDAMDAALSKASLPRDVKVYRGLHGDDVEKIYADMKPGDRFRDRAYGSTAIDHETARRGPVTFEVDVPAGYQAAVIPHKSGLDREILLRRDATYEVVGVRKTTYKNIDGEVKPETIVHVRVVPDDGPRPVSFMNHREADKIKAGSAIEILPRADVDDPLLAALRGTESRLNAGESLASVSGAAPRTAKGAPAPTGMEMEGVLRATQDRLAAGRDLGAISDSSPLRKSYVVSKQLEGGLPLTDTGRSRDLTAVTISSAPRTDDFFSQLTKPKTRDQYVAQNIGRAMREEGSHAAALAKVEREWAEMGGAPAARTVADDVTSAADVITKYERASAKLTEALGPEAPPAAQQAAKAFRDAEATVDRKTIERTTRAVDDHADPLPQRSRGIKGGPTLSRSQPQPVFGDVPLPPSSKDMLNEAGARKLDADAAFKRARAAETEAKMGARQAKETADASRISARKAALSDAAGPSQLGTLATFAGVAADLTDIPGMPHPRDIPVIGPLLSLYLKFKALKYTVGRFTGRVAATGDSKAAALAARTKERMAEAVDRTLGLVEKAAPKARGAAVAATTQLNRRLFDDGEPDAPKNASAQELAAVRIREIAAAVTRPDLISKQVAREFRGVTDPDLIAAAEKHLFERFVYLNRVAPKAPPPNPFSKREWKPSPMAAHDLAQRLSVINDPASAFTDPTPAKAETIKAVYPALLKMAQEWLIERVADTKHPVPYESRLRNSLLFEVPLDDSLHPDHAAVLATAHAPSPVTDAAPVQSGPPQSSIAANTNLSSVYRTGTERRAL